MATAEIRPVTIVVDSAETASGIPRLLQKRAGVTLDMQRLECGDYLPHPTCVVERKSDHDFAASILDGRLFSQLALMQAEFPLVVLLVEGDVHTTTSEIADESLHGALSYIAVLAGVRLLYSRSAADSSALIHRFALHLHHGLGYEIPLRTAKPKDMSVLTQYLVEGLPGVGPGRARALVEHFGSVRRLMAASHAEIAGAPGLGPKTADRIIELLDWQRKGASRR